MNDHGSNLAPRNYPWPAQEPANMRAGMQGQNFLTVMESNGPLSKVIIVMQSRKVSNLHIHGDTYVYVDVLQAEGPGALTLAGWNLEHEIWTPAGTTLCLPPGVPHVAVYPAPEPAAVVSPPPYPPDLVAMETRDNPTADDDIHPVEGYADLLVQRLDGLGLLDRVDPSPEMLAVMG